MLNQTRSISDAIQYHKSGQLAKAEQIYRQIVATEPGNADARHLLGVVAHQQGDDKKAVELIQAAIGLDPTQPIYHCNLGEVLRALRRLAEATAACEEAIRLRPGFAGAHYNLANLLKDQGRSAEAIIAYRRAIELQPGRFEAHNNLGNALKGNGRLQESIVCFQRAIQANPGFLDGYNNLGNSLADLGRTQEAVDCFRFVLERKPNHAAALCNLGNAHRSNGQFAEAVGCYQAALGVEPNLAAAHYNLGYAWQEQGRFTEAVACLEQALRCRPEYPEACNNLGVAVRDQGKVSEAIECFRRGLEIEPTHAVAHSNLVFAQHYRNGVTLKELADAHREFDRRHAAPLRKHWRSNDNDRDPNRRLRLGFVSADFRRHPVGYFLIRVLENLRNEECDTFCYCDQRPRDELTTRFESAARLWRNVLGSSDEQLAEQVRADRIDILFDLAGHTAHNRLLVFARKPAPIQITWIGYEGTTGLEAIDYLLADRYVVPAGSEPFYCEKVLRMPRGYLCYDPPTAAPPAGPTPAIGNEYVTFASFNNLAKISAQVVALWADILRRVPRSRLLLRYKGLNDEIVKRRYLDEFAALGVDSQRLDLLPTTSYSEHMATYRQVDIALDPFPFSGSVTTCESLWMGVPVVTCPGETFASRHTLSHLSNIGLTNTIAGNFEEYVELADALAADLPSLAALRSRLREQMAASPLCDGKRFAADLVVLLRQAWRQWISPIAPSQ